LFSNIIIIIPARGGSKRIPNKNIKLLGDKPLLAWTVQQALKFSAANVVVSTDDKKVADMAIELGAEVPFMRSNKFASDDANVIDAVLEVLEYYAKLDIKFDGVLLLQPTSPFRSIKTINKAVSMFFNSNGESVVSVSPVSSHPYWHKKIKNGVLIPFDSNYDGSSIRSQDLPDVYELNGLIYLSSPENLKEQRSFYSLNTKGFVVSSRTESIDIDTPFDWLLAETILSQRIKQ